MQHCRLYRTVVHAHHARVNARQALGCVREKSFLGVFHDRNLPRSSASSDPDDRRPKKPGARATPKARSAHHPLPVQPFLSLAHLCKACRAQNGSLPGSKRCKACRAQNGSLPGSKRCTLQPTQRAHTYFFPFSLFPLFLPLLSSPFLSLFSLPLCCVCGVVLWCGVLLSVVLWCGVFLLWCVVFGGGVVLRCGVFCCVCGVVLWCGVFVVCCFVVWCFFVVVCGFLLCLWCCFVVWCFVVTCVLFCGVWCFFVVVCGVNPHEPTR